MTEAQVKLYAALRVVTPIGWQIYGRSSTEQLIVNFQRETLGYFITPRFDGRPHQAITQDDVFAIWTKLRTIEDPQGRRRVVEEARRHFEGGSRPLSYGRLIE
jgi:hypothetical protein